MKGFRSDYLNNHQFRVWCRRFGALALVPMNNFLEAWDIILDEIPIPVSQKLMSFLQYFVDTWFNGKNGSSPILWNLYGSPDARTNNNVEGFHSRINRNLQAHSDIYTVISYFQTLDLEIVDLYLKAKIGLDKPKKQKKKDADKDFFLALIALEFQQGQINFKEFYSKLTYRVTFPYEDGNDYDCQFVDDDNLDEFLDENLVENSSNVDESSKSYKNKVEFENPFREVDFMKRIDKVKTLINPKVALTSELLYDELKVLNDYIGKFAILIKF